MQLRLVTYLKLQTWQKTDMEGRFAGKLHQAEHKKYPGAAASDAFA